MSAGPGEAATPAPSSNRGRVMRGLFEIVETVVLTVLIFFLIHTFVAQPFRVEQTSMETTLLPEQYVLVDKLTPRWAAYERGDIVVFQAPPALRSPSGAPFIKRVIGLPGDRVDLQDGFVLVNGIQIDEPYVFERRGEPEETDPTGGATSWIVPDDALFLLGDHRSASEDSRDFGPIEISSVLGRAMLRYWPFDAFGTLVRPTYPELAST